MFKAKYANRHLLTALLFYVIGSIGVGAYLSVADIELSIIGRLLFSQWGIVFLPIVVHFVLTRQPLKETLILRKIKFINVVLSIILAFLILPTMSLVNVISQFFVKNYLKDVMLELPQIPLLLGLLIMAVTPAILEEISMRSIIISNYRDKKVLTTCVISGFFFGMFHMNINQFLYAFAIGFFLCLTVHITGSILSSMIMHFTINATSVITSTLLPVYMEWVSKSSGKAPVDYAQLAAAATTPKDLLPGLILMLIINLVSLPLVGMTYYLLMVYNNKTDIFKKKMTTAQVLELSSNEGWDGSMDSDALPMQATQRTQERVFTISLILSMGVFLIFVTLNEFILPALGY